MTPKSVQSSCKWTRSPSITLCLLLAAGPFTAWAQSPGQSPAPVVKPAAGADLQVTVSNVSTQGQLIRVPVNKSVMITFSEPVREVRLAKSEIAEVTAVSPKQILLTGLSFGTTQLIAFVNGDTQKVFDVAVEIEMDTLLSSIRAAVPRARVKAHALLDQVVLTGSVPDADSAKRVAEVANAFSANVVNQLRVAGVQQVLLRCTVAEVNRSVTRQLGFNGWIAGDDMRDMFFINNLDQINPANIGAPEGALATGQIPFFVGQDGIPVTDRTTLSFGFPRVEMQVFVQALKENGFLKILAEPNLVAISGQKASFLAGGEIPVPISTDDKISVEWKEFGVRLNFTPAVLSEGLIRLQVAPELSEPDLANSVTFGGISIPAFSTRRVETVVEIGSGQTLAIGGLLSERLRSVSRKVPGLGEIPVLGALFRSVEYQSDETELVVLVTPELVEPVSGSQITSVPGADYVPPNDLELYLMGEIEGRPAEQMPKLAPRVNNTWPVKSGELRGPASSKLRGPMGPAGTEEAP